MAPQEQSRGARLWQRVRFRVEVQLEGRKKKLGYFMTAMEAARRYARFVEETQAEPFE